MSQHRDPTPPYLQNDALSSRGPGRHPIQRLENIITVASPTAASCSVPPCGRRAIPSRSRQRWIYASLDGPGTPTKAAPHNCAPFSESASADSLADGLRLQPVKNFLRDASLPASRPPVGEGIEPQILVLKLMRFRERTQRDRAERERQHPDRAVEALLAEVQVDRPDTLQQLGKAPDFLGLESVDE